MLEDDLHPGIRGGLRLLDGRWVVILNGRDGRRRARFTLAHELGHIALGDGALGDGALGEGALGDAGREPRFGIGRPVREALCDAFAAELLMPARVLRSEWRRLGSAQAVARRFDVSLAAARRRLRDLRLVEGRARRRGAGPKP